MFVTHRLAGVRYLGSHYVVRGDDGRIEVREENNALCLINTKFIMIQGGKVVFDGTDEQLWAAENTFLRDFVHGDEDLS
ncbi:MAG TPA: hypothetical protein VIC84_21015 [Blastocatellia bacterium]|jgi:ABC-type transporter Mla maintaining outer membrane lipid asymmetry ATPase subunit MlaF